MTHSIENIQYSTWLDQETSKSTRAPYKSQLSSTSSVTIMTEQLKSQEEASTSVQDADTTARAVEVKEETGNAPEKPAGNSSDQIIKEVTKKEADTNLKTSTASEVKEVTTSGSDRADEVQEATKDDSKATNGVHETAEDNIENINGVKKSATDSASGKTQANETINDGVKDTDEKEAPKDAQDADHANISSNAELPSKRVQEGQKWNNRDRDRPDHKKNIKSDLTSQEESSDPVAIRKQVRNSNHYLSILLTLMRLNSTSPIQISTRINSSSPKLKATIIFQSPLALSIPSNVCAISSLSAL